MDDKTELQKKALAFAESKERAGCAYFNGLYRGYIAGYQACEGKETPNENSNCIKPDVIKSACDRCGSPNEMISVCSNSKCSNSEWM
jgi:hypothetical protein